MRTEVVEMVAEVLGVPPSAVDTDADLIAQGLDSIRMMALAGAWRRRGMDVDFAALAADPSVRAWSALLEAAPPRPATAGPSTPAATTADEPFPMAPMQHALWVGRTAGQELGGVAAHLYVEFDAPSWLDPHRLTRAATALAERHPMLRVQFLPDGTQRIASPSDFPVAVEDLRDHDDAAVDRRLAAIRDVKSHQQLTDAVLELSVTLLPGRRSRLHVDLDMQAADAMSYRTLMGDLAALYAGRALPEIGYSYREYLAHVDAARRDAPARDRQWWSQRIAELPDPPALPLTPVERRTDPHRSTRRWHWLEPAARDVLYAHARGRGITPAMALAASFADTVAGWSRDPRFLLNVPLFGREPLHPDVPRLVGDFTSSLLLDVDLGGAATAAERGRALQETMHAAAAHAAYPGLSVLRDLGRHRGAPVLAPVVFTSALGLGELFCDEVVATFGPPSWIISQGPQVLLDAQATEFDGGVLINWDVREQAFEPGFIDAMFARHVDEVRRLAGDAAAWDQPRPPLLPAAQRRVRDAVNSVTAQRSGRRLPDRFLAAATEHPTATAVLSDSGSLSYAELHRQATAVAAALQHDGLRPGDTVAVRGPKGPQQIPALLGVLMAGGVYLPIGVDQPADRAERITAVGEVNRTLVCGTPLPAGPVPALTVSEVIRRGAALKYRPGPTDPAHPAYVLFTSGSTGEPKGVEVTHAAAMNTVEFLNGHFAIGRSDRCLALSALECDMSVLDIFGTLTAGGTIVVVDEHDRRNPDRWARQIQAHGVTVLNFLPGWLEMLVQVAPAGSLSSLRVVPTGGDWVRPELVRRLRAHAPRLRFAGLGGATETAVHATICEVTEPPASWTAVPYGVPFPNNACRVVNAHGDDCPDWVPGELWIGGRGIASGYRGPADLTAQRFVEHDGRSWYRTGDLARYRPDGSLEFVGRADDRVKVSGYRVELGEVEAALRRVPGVAAAVAATLPAPDGQRLAAIVQVVGQLTADAVRSDAARLLPEHMVPRRIRLVDAIPYTVGGKIDRAAVRRLVAESADEPGATRAPRSALERALVRIVGALLDTPQLRIDDDFFGLGADSVTATAAVARIRTWLDTPALTVADVFATRTVAGLAELLQRRDGRIEQVAELFLEVDEMDAAGLGAAVPERPVASRVAPAGFARWIRRCPGPNNGAAVLFPHAGAAAASYRALAEALAVKGPEVFVVQYPQHPGRLTDPAADTVAELAADLFAAGPWEHVTPLRLFGHCMGATVAFEFAKLAERHGIGVTTLWVSGGAAPSCHLPPLPTTDEAILADIAAMGGTDPRLLADPEFRDLVVPAVRADYVALNRYSCSPDDTIDADIAVLSACDDDRVGPELLRRWEAHTTGRFGMHPVDGGHFYLFEHLDTVAGLVNADA